LNATADPSLSFCSLAQLNSFSTSSFFIRAHKHAQTKASNDDGELEIVIIVKINVNEENQGDNGELVNEDNESGNAEEEEKQQQRGAVAPNPLGLQCNQGDR